jgi:hypothetical protein
MQGAETHGEENAPDAGAAVPVTHVVHLTSRLGTRDSWQVTRDEHGQERGS